jgi:hypothetical protein
VEVRVLSWAPSTSFVLAKKKKSKKNKKKPESRCSSAAFFMARRASMTAARMNFSTLLDLAFWVTRLRARLQG